jgi:hypothetical protein
MGIAQGTFVSLRYGADIAGEAALRSSQFLGTGVVKAHRAEGAIRGVAICIDESVQPFVGELHPAELLHLRGLAAAYTDRALRRGGMTGIRPQHR